MTNLRSLTQASLFTAAGIAAGVLFHTLGIAGQVVLPLHYPALLAGFLLGWRWGLGVGLLTPLLSSLVTGMPPLIPSALLMAPEAAVYGAVVGLMRKPLGIYPALISALVLGRIAWGIAVWLLTPVLGLKIPVVGALTAAAITGLPGIVAQIVLVPLLVRRLEALQKA